MSDDNRGFALHGDVTNALDYHLWALALVMGTEYKARPMHTSASYDVSAFYSLRKAGQFRLPPAAAAAATVARYAETEFLGREAVKQMCDAFEIAPLEASGTGAAALARLESCVSEETCAAAAFWAALGGVPDSTKWHFFITAPKVHNTLSGVPPREAPFRSIDLEEVALRSLPT